MIHDNPRPQPLWHQSGAGCGSCNGEHEGIALAERPRPACVVYESKAFQQIAGDSLHPGGIELTGDLVEMAGLPERARLLDIGCGTGATMRFLRDTYGYQMTGIDQSTKLLEQAGTIDPTLSVQAGEADFLEFPSFSFDGVLMECVLSLCAMKEEALHEAFCVLKKGGRLLLGDLYDKTAGETPASVEEEPGTTFGLFGLLNRERLVALIESLGFTNVRFRDRSEALASFAARAILQYGSMEAFWRAVVEETADQAHLTTDLLARAGKAGYCLITAEKPE